MFIAFFSWNVSAGGQAASIIIDGNLDVHAESHDHSQAARVTFPRKVEENASMKRTWTLSDCSGERL